MNTYNWIVKRPETAAAISAAVSAGTCTTPDQVAAIAAEYGDEVFWTGTMPGHAEPIDTAVSEILREIGIPAHLRGYQYVREAVKLAVQDMSRVNKMTTAIYPAVAEKFGTTASRAEKAIRTAIESAFDRGNLDTLQRYFGHTVSGLKGKPTKGDLT